MDAFDANVLIYAAIGDRRGDRVAGMLAHPDSLERSVGSTLLIPEVMSHPIRRNDLVERDALEGLLGRIQLRAVDIETAELGAALRAKYGLHTADAIHLATAVLWGAECFHTNNTKDFGQHIDEIEIVFP